MKMVLNMKQKLVERNNNKEELFRLLKTLILIYCDLKYTKFKYFVKKYYQDI